MKAWGRHLGVGVAALAFAGLSLASGFDRMSEQRPAISRFVPSSLAAVANRRAAADALADGDFMAAKIASQTAVQRDPYDTTSLGFLGASRLNLGDEPGAHAAFLQANRLSQREPFSQLYFFEQELAVGSYARAAERLDAFLRGVSNREVAQDMLAMYEERAGDSLDFAARLSESPRWASVYLRAEGSNPQRLRQRAAFLARDVESLDGLGCSAVLPMVQELARLNYREDAEKVVLRHCPDAAPLGPVADAEFEHFGDEGAPIGWRRLGSGDVRVTRLTGEVARIEMENRSSVTRLALSQPVALDPGTYRLKAKIDGPGGQKLAASLDCSTPKRPGAGRMRLDREGQTLVASNCPDQVLSLWLRPGSGRLVVDRVDLVAVSP